MSNCVCQPSEKMLFPCSGAANVGQVANAAAVAVASEGKAKMYCLAGVGGNIPGILDGTRQAKKIIAIDGCAAACAKKILENASFNIDGYILVSEEGIPKTPGKSEYTANQMQQIKNLIETKLDE